MVSQDNRLLPLPAGERSLDRPLSDLAQSKPYGVSASEPMHLRDYLFVILKRKWLILTLVVVVTSLVTIQMYRQPSIYEAAAMIQIEPKPKSVLTTGKEIVINTGADKDPAYWNTQLKLLENPALARQVVLSLGLQQDPNFFGTPGQTSIMSSLRRLFRGEDRVVSAPPPVDNKITVVGRDEVTNGQLSAQELARLEPYEDVLAATLVVEPVIGTNLIKLHYTHTNPELAKRIADAYADIFVQNNAQRQSTGTEEAEKLLAEKIAEYQHTISVDEQARFNYIKDNNLPFTSSTTGAPAPGTNLAADKLAKLATQLLDAENEAKSMKALYEAAAKAPDPNEIPEVGDNKRIQTLREKLDVLKQKRDELLVIYTPEWPEVKKVDAQIQMLEGSLAKAPREVVAAMRSRYEAAATKENDLRRSYNAQRAEFTGQNQAELQLSVINQRLETNKQYLATLLQRQNEIDNTKTDSMKTNNVTVVQYSKLPPSPIGPARMRNILIAFLLSLGAGVGLAFLLDYLDDTLKTVEDVDRYIHLPALALIPTNRPERARLKGRNPAPEANETTALALIDDVRSPIAEAYRHLRTSLLLSSAGQPPKTILVTSSQPSEGKTTTAVNTAVMLAQTGAEVVIIDCDLRRPRLHAHFNVPNTKGVTNYLSGESDLDALLQPYEKLPNLKLLTSGPVPPNPAELLGSDEMRKLLSLAGERFTHIIIDSPPAISFTDASILSTMVDGVVLVVHGGRSSRAVVRRAKQQLLDVGANIFGVVLNNVRLEATNYYYYAGYYSSYYTDDDGSAPDASASAGAGRAS